MLTEGAHQTSDDLTVVKLGDGPHESASRSACGPWTASWETLALIDLNGKS